MYVPQLLIMLYVFIVLKAICLFVVVAAAGWSLTWIHLLHLGDTHQDWLWLCTYAIDECVAVGVCVYVCSQRCLPYVSTRTIRLSVDEPLDSVYGHEVL